MKTVFVKSVDCVVRYSANAYNTNTVRGARASSTSSMETAAQRLAVKLFGDGAHQVEQVGGNTLHAVWRLTPKAS